jgi:hypothetical protein
VPDKAIKFLIKCCQTNGMPCGARVHYTLNSQVLVLVVDYACLYELSIHIKFCKNYLQFSNQSGTAYAVIFLIGSL